MNNLEELRDQILEQNPTAEQKDAIFTEELEFLLRASPGSGKTWTSCRRFIWRAANWPYRAGGLALLSFTNTAIQEFQEATVSLGKSNLTCNPNYVGTFDAFVERFIITPFGHLISGTHKRPRLYIAPRPGDRNNQSLSTWITPENGPLKPIFAWDIEPYPDDNNKVRFRASRSFGGHQLTIGRDNNPVDCLLALGFYTHAQRAYWACKLLFSRPHIAELIAKRFPEIIVDEAQDTNAWLLILLNFLRDKGVKVTLIGDPDQCIYSFSMASATSLPSLRDKWKIPEKPLSQSFRCNNEIAIAVRNVSANLSFSGYGNASHIKHRPFIIRETSEEFGDSIQAFQELLNQSEISQSGSAIICRGHPQLQSIRGELTFDQLKGNTKELAEASFLRDCRKDYREAFKKVGKVLRSIVDNNDLWNELDENPESQDSVQIKLAIWQFVKSPSCLPSVNLAGDVWITQLRSNLNQLIYEISGSYDKKLGNKIRKTGLKDTQSSLPLFSERLSFPTIRQETIHQVKGESIDGVLVLGSAKFWNSVVKSIVTQENSEDKRLAYVAMTRARNLLLLGLPDSHLKKYEDKWISWGFGLL